MKYITLLLEQGFRVSKTLSHFAILILMVFRVIRLIYFHMGSHQRQQKKHRELHWQKLSAARDIKSPCCAQPAGDELRNLLACLLVRPLTPTYLFGMPTLIVHLICSKPIDQSTRYRTSTTPQTLTPRRSSHIARLSPFLRRSIKLINFDAKSKWTHSNVPIPSATAGASRIANWSERASERAGE